MSEAHDEIRNLLGRYCEAIDDGDFTAVGALFAHGRLADELGTPLASGASEVEAFYRRGTRLHDGSPRTKHITTNSIITVDGDTAEARSSYVVLQATGGLPLQPVIAGRYADRFACDAGVWRFEERRFAVDLVGDLSHHLRYEIS